MIGERIGSYEITTVLGYGTQGTVYAARHVELPREVAIKVLLPRLTSDAEKVRRFFDEARAAASIQHPGVVEVFDCGRDAHDRIYIVMERLVGETLFERLRRAPPTISEAIAILRQLLIALDATHGNTTPIVHRDLKPENVFLVADGGHWKVKVVDFGIAKLAPSLRSSGTLSGSGLFGTPPYMSPEQCRGDQIIDRRTDLYALGCLLHEMITGAPPFGFGGARELVQAHCSDEPPALSAGAIDVPPELDEIAGRLLAKDPSDRPGSCHEVLAALDRVPLSPDPLATGLSPRSTVRTAPLETATPAPRTWRERVWRRLVDTPPWIAGGVACFVGAVLLGVSIVAGVGDSYGSSPNWGMAYVVLVPLIISAMVRSLHASESALRTLVEKGLVRSSSGDAHVEVATAASRLGRAMIALVVGFAIASVAISIGEWRHRPRIPGLWWTESPVMGVTGAICQGLLIAAILGFVVYGVAWSQLVQSWTTPRSRLRLRGDPRSVLAEPIGTMLATSLLVQLVLYLSNVQHIAEVRGVTFLGAFAIEDASDLLDLGTGRYPSSTPLVASALVMGFFAAAMVALRGAATASSVENEAPRPAWPIAPSIALLVVPTLGTLVFRLGPIAAAIVLVVLATRRRHG